MQPADGVAVCGGVQRENRHRKRLAAILRIAPAERHEAIEMDLRVGAEVIEVVIDKAGIEQVDTGGHGRMGGEDVVDAGSFERFLEGQLLAFDEEADAFDRQETPSGLRSCGRRSA